MTCYNVIGPYGKYAFVVTISLIPEITFDRFQIVLVYFFAGLKKIDMDWLTGWSMQNLSKHWVFAPFSLVMEREVCFKCKVLSFCLISLSSVTPNSKLFHTDINWRWRFHLMQFIDVVIVHLGGFIIDLFGGWLLLFSKSRPFAILFLSKFHVMNATMFEIGKSWLRLLGRSSLV